ncbi:hypothetical protein [Neobacillus sp. 114]|uniref:hypothetical protein n=1 Tax=Neobacillus sp. 114 TaxID=3048535 RepID=UPI0024C3EA9C|nr:hypothetical protein [Neobacillus sp. 114]
MTGYTFLPWMREGLASYIPKEDSFIGAMDSRVKLPVSLQVNHTLTASVQVRLYGPGDVTGFDQRQVLRTDPPHLTTGFEANYFASIEFDRPDFPWMFTPAAAKGNRLRPWIILIVLSKQEAKLEMATSQSLPILTIKSPYHEKLPDLGESWAWAHTQVNGEAAGDQGLKGMLKGDPKLNLSRLICPRYLLPSTSYIACVVPAFDIGVKAGLGEQVDENGSLLPAWDVKNTSDTTDLRLPVYYHWEFATGEAGDFESLVWALEPRRMDPDLVGVRPLNVTGPGYNLPSCNVPGLEGALRVSEGTSPGLNGIPKNFREALKDLLNKPQTLTTISDLSDSVIVPPIYGRWHAAKKSIDSTSRPWLEQLNLDPRLRVASGVGTKIVQEKQDQLMASAWEQIGEIDRANQALRQAQLGRSVGTAILKSHLSNLPAESLLQLTGAVHSRLLWEEQTIVAKERGTTLTEVPASAAFRRITRPNGPVARRVTGGGSSQKLDLIKGINSLKYRLNQPLKSLRGAAVLEGITDSSGVRRRLEQANKEALSKLDAKKTLEGFKDAAIIIQEAILRTVDPILRDPKDPPRLPIEEGKKILLDRLDPEKTVTKRMQARIFNPDPMWRPADPLEQIMAAPEFPTPMYRALADHSQDWLLPGLEHVPPNTLTLLETNPRFIEAFMVGLNHEMSRELLWRRYPTDQRGTYFRQFWDARGRIPRQASTKDIPPIHEWVKALGDHMSNTSVQEQLVLLIRGDLLRRYPNATIYAIKGEWMTINGKKSRQPKSSPSTDEQKFSQFSGKLEPDITFLGFDLSESTARGNDTTDPGWFFFLQQQPTEPRFGLDVSQPSTGMPLTWRDLSWNDVHLSEGRYVQLSGGLKASFQTPGTPANIKWSSASNSAALAYITLQRPFRIAVHASDLLPI